MTQQPLTVIVQVSQTESVRGCCANHGGIDYCDFDGFYKCRDGWKSSCACDGF